MKLGVVQTELPAQTESSWSSRKIRSSEIGFRFTASLMLSSMAVAGGRTQDEATILLLNRA
jgi:hypothetical protein